MLNTSLRTLVRAASLIVTIEAFQMNQEDEAHYLAVI